MLGILISHRIIDQQAKGFQEPSRVDDLKGMIIDMGIVPLPLHMFLLLDDHPLVHLANEPKEERPVKRVANKAKALSASTRTCAVAATDEDEADKPFEQWPVDHRCALSDANLPWPLEWEERGTFYQNTKCLTRREEDI